MERLLARCDRQKMVGVEAERGSPVLPDYPGIGQNHTAAELEQKLADQKKIADGVQTYYDRFLGWSMEFGMASLARKRIIIAQLFKRIELDRGYNLHFEVDCDYEQFIDSVNVKGKQGITAVGITLPPKVRPKAGKTAKASQTAKNGRKRKAEPISA